MKMPAARKLVATTAVSVILALLETVSMSVPRSAAMASPLARKHVTMEIQLMMMGVPTDVSLPRVTTTEEMVMKPISIAVG